MMLRSWNMFGLTPYLIAMLFLVVGSGISQAATINLTDTSSVVINPGDSGSLSYQNISKNNFSQTFTFQLAQPGRLQLNVTALYPSISKFTISLEGLSGHKWTSLGKVGGNTTTAKAGDLFTLNYAAQTPLSSYRLVISGNTPGKKQGDGQGYSGTYQVSLVPLPPAVLLFATGLAGLWVLRRQPQRRKPYGSDGAPLPGHR